VKSGNVSKAKNLFETSVKKSLPMYITMITGKFVFFSLFLSSFKIGLMENNQKTEALEFFRQINLSPNEYLYSTIFKLCVELGDQQSLQFGKNLFEKMPNIFHNDKILLNSALNLFNKCENISKSEEIFSKMNKDLISYSIMMKGYLTNGMPQKAIDLFFKIKNPDRVCFSILFNACAQLATSQSLTLGKQVLSRLPGEYRESIDILYSLSKMFIKCNDVNNAESIFNRLNRDVKCYGSLMKLYQTRNEPEKILNLFQRMKKEEIQANEMIYVLLIDACAAIGDLSLSKSIISQIPKSLLNNLWIQNSSIDMWVGVFF
jgi:pentatricopeptide repeat protein